MTTFPFRGIVDPAAAAEYRAAGWWGDVTVADHVARHARERPGAPAFIADAGRLSWSDYERRSDELAGVMIAAGLEPGTRVATLLPDAATVHIALVAAEKAGLTIVGIAARAGDLEVRHLLERTGATAIVTHADHRGVDTASSVADWRAGGLPLRRHVVVPRFEAREHERGDPITVDGEPMAADADATNELVARRRLGPDDLFLVNSTSGTTGLPKCVTHTQNRWLYFHQLAVAHGRITDHDVMYSALPAPFGFGLWTAHFTPTVLGIPTVVRERFSADEAFALVETHRVTVLACVTTQFIMMLNSPALDRHDLSSLRVMFTGGEAVPYERARAFEEKTGCAVLQFYGSNETGVVSGTALDDPPERRLRTAGRVIPEMQVRLFEDGEDATPTGHGRPAVRGPATSVGYLDDPEANAELFTDDGWMLMADICTIDSDGYLSVVGRESDIIIRGGKNISAAEVEDEVGSHPAVAHAAAVAVPDPVFGERVCVYVELQPGSSLRFDDLIEHLVARGNSKEILPEHLVVLDSLPRSIGDKVAKGALRDDARLRFAPRPSS